MPEKPAPGHAVRPIAVLSRHARLRVDRRSVAAALRVLDLYRPSLELAGSVLDNSGEISIALLSDEELAGLHGRFLGDSSATDVITFSGDPALGLAGEICVSVDAAERSAGARRGAFAAELTLYLVHGWLHLAGHDDLLPHTKRAMRRAEARALGILRSCGAMPALALGPRRE